MFNDDKCYGKKKQTKFRGMMYTKGGKGWVSFRNQDRH